eukprot:GHVU01112101.1.p1 GENE.GHVU01112101.1~~GHVU01112101.1.p1  ORF type:complete len:251 (-),score=5.41 GHVU01112101.1:32-784(-)
MCANKLMLNDEKTEIIHMTSKHRVSKCNIPSINIGNADVSPSPNVRNLGIIFDSNLTMEDHVKIIARTASIGIHNIGRIRHYLAKPCTEKLIHAFVTSRLDYCNSLLYGVPNNMMCHLQRIQNSAARLILRANKFDHITPVLISLHWLPIKQRIAFNVLLITYKALNGQAPDYISSLLAPQCHVTARDLRSTSSRSLTPTRVKTHSYGQRAFCAAAPELWNLLPSELQSCDSVDTFKKKLKTFLFKDAFY